MLSVCALLFLCPLDPLLVFCWTGKEGNFDRLSDNVIDTLGVLYDYESIMHYSRYAFSANGQATILPKQDPWANLGQRDDFSHRDIERLNILYHCGEWPRRHYC